MFPNCLVQWEDFHADIAFQVLDRYRTAVPSFNDDIQGTAAVVLGGLLAALRITGGQLADQRIVYAGAGGAGAGIGRLIDRAMRRSISSAGGSAPTEAGTRAAHSRIDSAHVFVDSKGLLHDGRAIDDPHKQAVALSHDAFAKYGFVGDGPHELLEVVRRVKPTVLIGTTAQPGKFSEDVLREMARHVERPIVLPLSNPTSKVECTPDEAIRWTDGRAIVATGTAFDPVQYEGRIHAIGQANNVFVFPGVGLGCILSRLAVIDDDIFLVAAEQLASLVPEERLAIGAIYPNQSELRSVSAAVAAAVVSHIHRQRREPALDDARIADSVKAAMWFPGY
jgi:malic enzyme